MSLRQRATTAVCAAVMMGLYGMALPAQPSSAPRPARVLLIAAHPDDEDTQLLAWLVKGEHVDAAYLSLTRGDGGQNLIGNELGDALGVIRTEELLAARRLDGAHQFFTRAYDFGFSKTAAESFSHWPQDSLLSDVVTVIRAFRPDIIIAVFSGTPRDGHGQHQVSGIIAREAYDVSGDTVRFPVSRYGEPWTAAKFYRDRRYFGQCDSCLTIPVDSNLAALAVESRHQHRSQGFASIRMQAGPYKNALLREGTHVDSATPRTEETSLFQGIDAAFGAAGPSNLAPAYVVGPDTVIVSDTLVSQPWWLATPRQGDMFTVPVSRVSEDQRWRLVDSVQRSTNANGVEVDRRVVFVPPVSVTFDRTVAYIPAQTHVSRTFDIVLRSGLDRENKVRLSIQVPKGLSAHPTSTNVTMAPHDVRHVRVEVKGSVPAGTVTLAATAEVDGRTYTRGYVPIDYPHIRAQNLYRPAAVQLVSVDIKVPRDLTVAYIPGVGDNVLPELMDLGVPVTVIDSTALATTDFSRYHTVVVGTRAYEADSLLIKNNSRLLDYVRQGGTLVVQYGQYEMTQPGMMPYPITLARPADRVTIETAPVRILDSNAVVLHTPNRITDADFADWVQERSLYMPHTFDSHYHAVLSINDPGEPPNDGGILMTSLGKGTYIYTTLSFFRQLPAGNPGGARLFVNLLSVKQCCDVP